MILTKLVLDRRNPAVRQDLRDCQDLHRSLMRLFGEDRRGAGVLYRLRLNDSSASVYLLSEDAPTGAPAAGMTIVGSCAMDEFFSEIAEGKRFGFDLLASPCKKVSAEGKKNSQRRILRTEEERQQWLAAKGAAGGFKLLWVRESGQEHRLGSHDAASGGKFAVDGIHFCGALRVTDPERFRASVREGIGPEKAYGMGMLLLRAE